MLEDAVAAFLDSVSERSFDEPLLAMLRALGFERVHLVHGASEFGKDVIAQRDAKQWAFQSKAGDVNLGGFREIRGQLDELRLSELSHPAFDRDLPREPVLVMTGRLTGGAPVSSQEYSQQAEKKREPGLEVWSRDSLVGFLAGNTDAVLRGSMDGQLLAVLGSVDEETATMRSLESFSRRWNTWEPDRLSGLGVIEAALVCERLADHERLDLACHLALCLISCAWAAAPSEADGASIADAAGQLFESYALRLWQECDERLLREKGLVGYSGFSAWVTYPVRCVRIAEIIGLLVLRLGDHDDEAREMRGWLVDFLAAQPGSAHPIGDQYAVSLVPAVLAVAGQDPPAVAALLRRTAVWLCNAYGQDGLGLAGIDAEPGEEITRLLGAPLEGIDLDRRRDSYIATVLLDLCSGLGLSDLYPDVFNDISAVGIYPRVLRLGGGADQFLRTGIGNRLDPHVDFAVKLDDKSLTAPHHADASGQELRGSGRSWDLLAISAALRDRHFFGVLEEAGSYVGEGT